MRLFKPREVVGVDIGTHSVKIVELKESSKGYQLENFAIGPVSSQAIVDGAIMDAGANQSFGADWPASAYLSTYKPLELIEAAVTRRLPGEPDMPPRNPDQSVSLAEAIIAMTRNTAIQVGELESLGSITEGKLADLVLLEKNLFDIPAETINATPVTATVVNGRIVHEQ